MTNPTDAVRAALHALADEGRPVDLGPSALAGLRRRRRRTMLTGIVVMVLAMGGLAWPLWPDDDRPPATPETTTTLYYSDGVTVLARFGPDPVGLDGPAGHVVNQVLAELSRANSADLNGKSWESIRAGGYQITTTVDVDAQRVLDAVVNSTMDGQPSNLQAAAVVVEPGTGRVLAYHGGSDDSDYAGVYVGEDGAPVGFGAHPPGATFFTYTLAAALRAGYSLNSLWQWTEHDQPGRWAPNRVRNYAVCPSNPTGPDCTLLESVAASLNVPLYDVTVSVTPGSVLAMAYDAGIEAIWTDNRTRIDLRTTPPLTAPLEGGIGMEVGIGQYPVTVLDQANAMATFASGGIRTSAHFVRTVSHGDQLVYAETLPTPDRPRVLAPAQLADLTYALTQESGDAGLAIKTGAWEYGLPVGENSDVWSIGYTSAVATAVWIGNRADVQPLRDKEGQSIWGAGLPTQILREVIDGTQQAWGVNPPGFPPPAFAGDLNPNGSIPTVDGAS